MARGWLEISKEAIDVDFAGHKVWYDNANEQLVLMKKNVYYSLALEFGAKLSSPLNFVHAGPVLDVKFSLCRRFMAIQRNDTTVEVVDLVLATETRLTCRPKRGNLVLRGGVLWLQREPRASNPGRVDNDADDLPSLCIVARAGLEVHRLPNQARGEDTCKLLGTIKHTIHCFWYVPDHQLLVLATGSGTEMRPYHFQNGHLPIKLAKFSLQKLPPARNMLVTKLYGAIHAIEMLPSSRRINVYRLGRESSELVRELELTSPGSIYLSVVDNLICVHNMEGRFTCMYDIMAHTRLPCVAPSSIYRAWGRDDADTPVLTGQVDGSPAELVLQEGESIGLEPVGDEAHTGAEDARFTARLTQMSLSNTNPAATLVGHLLTHIDEQPVDNVPFDRVVDCIDEADRPLRLRFAAEVRKDEDVEKASRDPPISDEDLLYSTSWVFLAPHWILDSKKGHVWRLELNLDSVPLEALRVAREQVGANLRAGGDEIEEATYVLRDPRRLVRFLLRRACSPPLSSVTEFTFGPGKRDASAYAKAVLLHCLRALMASLHASPDVLLMIFNQINIVYLRALRERASTAAQAPPPAPVGGASSFKFRNGLSSATTSSVPPGALGGAASFSGSRTTSFGGPTSFAQPGVGPVGARPANDAGAPSASSSSHTVALGSEAGRARTPADPPLRSTASLPEGLVAGAVETSEAASVGLGEKGDTDRGSGLPRASSLFTVGPASVRTRFTSSIGSKHRRAALLESMSRIAGSSTTSNSGSAAATSVEAHSSSTLPAATLSQARSARDALEEGRAMLQSPHPRSAPPTAFARRAAGAGATGTTSEAGHEPTDEHLHAGPERLQPQRKAAHLSAQSSQSSFHENRPQRVLRHLMSDFRAAGRIALKDIRCYNRSAVVLQIDVFTWVFMPLTPDTADTESGLEACSHISMYLLAYIQSLQAYEIPTEKYIHELLSWLLVMGHREHVLRQLLQHHVPTDSRRLARALLEASAAYPPFWELALDMMHRLGHHDLVIRALLDRRQLVAALQVIHHHPQYLLHGDSHGKPASDASKSLQDGSLLVTAVDLLECAFDVSAARQGSTAPFFALYSFFMSVSPRTVTALGDDPSPLAAEVDDLRGRLCDVLGEEEAGPLAKALGVC